MFKDCAIWIEWTRLTTKELLWDVVAHNNWTSQPIGPFKSDNYQAATSTALGDMLLSPSQLGILTGVFFALFLNYKLKNNYELLKAHAIISNLVIKSLNYYPLYIVLCFAAFLIQSPIFLLISILFKIYRQIILLKLKKRHGKHFKGFLEGNDIVWALEDNQAKSIINIMAIIQGDAATKSSEVLLTFRKRFAERLLSPTQKFPKMFYKRLVDSGYYYWTDENEYFIEDYIRYMDVPTEQFNERTINKSHLVELISEQCNKCLPHEHTASWEILIGQNPLERLPNGNSDIGNEFPILFRVHHSLGDGIAILRLFLETIANKEKTKRNPWIDYARKLIHLPDLTIHSEYNKQLTSIDNHYLNRIFFNKLITQRKFNILMQKLWCLLITPATIVTQVMTQKPDTNELHRATPLSGKKIASWYFESDEGEHNSLLNKIKAIKRSIPKTRFSDVLLTALSSSLQKHFQLNQQIVPQDITIVIPTRIEPENSKILKIHNRFSCALQKLPINIDNKSTNVYNRINKVKEQSDKLWTSYDFQINYWIMSFIASLFPENILCKILSSAHCTMAISNVPGPQNLCKVNNLLIKNINFWLPNRTTTGIGLSILTYNNKLQLGILADKAILSQSSDCDFILKNIVHEINELSKQ